MRQIVGALSIVRFRMVVRDTQDTVYVICAVVLGMAVGASDLWVSIIGIVVVAIAAAVGTLVLAQSTAPPPSRDPANAPPEGGDFAFPGAPGFNRPPPFGPGGVGPGPGGPRGPGMGVVDRELVAQFDQDGDGRLNAGERKAARVFLERERAYGLSWSGPPGGPGRRGGPPGFSGGRGADTPPEPGVALTPEDVDTYPAAPFYDPLTLRTLFLEFESDDWAAELADFNNTDVEVPATLIVDGKKYPEVGVHFRGNTSNMMVPEGRKRPLNLSLDFVDEDQDVQGYHTLNLLNAHEDPTFMRTVLAFDIAREYFPAPKANFVRVVINGENWGIYISSQQFNKVFIKEWFDTKKGDRWKVQGSPGGRGGVELDPLVAANDPAKPLLSKLLAVPSLRAKYLGYVREMAEKQLDWKWLGSRVQAYRALIADEVKRDTRKLDTFEAFEEGTAAGAVEEGAVSRARQPRLKDFADQRRDYLLKVIPE